MIPSDHFVRFYNEVFKYLDARGELQKYYAEISRHQNMHCLEDFQKNGLKAVYEYYVKIRKEENCDMDMEFEGEHLLKLKMNKCPSLSKVLDNDAEPCPKYCYHCPGWSMPLYARAHLYVVEDLMGLDQPQCVEWLYDDLEMAKAKYHELCQSRPRNELFTSFPVN